jgi:hypothetical protein
MWSELVAWAERSMIAHKPQMASPRDMTIPACVDAVQEALDWIRTDFQRWQSTP